MSPQQPPDWPYGVEGGHEPDRFECHDPEAGLLRICPYCQGTGERDGPRQDADLAHIRQVADWIGSVRLEHLRIVDATRLRELCSELERRRRADP